MKLSLHTTLAILAILATSTLGGAVPAVPENFAGALVEREVALSWTDASDGESGFRIYRAFGEGDYVLIAEIAAGSTGFIDSGRPVGEAMRYKVTAFNDLGESLAAMVEVEAVPERSSGSDWVWIEAETFTTTTFPGNGKSWLRPATAAEVEGLSNGNNFSYLPTQAEKDAGYVFNFNITYTVNIPKDGDYLLYVRRAYKYGVFKWRIDAGEWNFVAGNAPVLEEIPWRTSFPLNWAEGGSTAATAGTHTLEISVNPGVDFPTASAAAKGNYLFDSFILTQTPFKPAGVSKPGSKLARANPGQWPFEPSVDTYAESPIDLSYLNEAVAGQDGWVTRQGSEFLLGNGGKARFFGATVTGGTFSSYSAQAEFLAKKGFNIVRFHSSIDDRNAASDSINNVNDSVIAQAQQCVAAFKQHGIYTNLSHFFILGHRVRAAWNIPGYDELFILNNDRAPFGIFFWNEDFKAAYKAWVTELLTRPNPWDAEGTPLAQDPAIALFEILNEDNLFFHTFQPANYPEVQRQLLETLFANWLVGTYGSLTAALDTWGATPRTRDDLEAGRMEVLAAAALRAGGSSTALRGQAQVEFMAGLQAGFWTEMRDFIRSLGCEALCIPTNWKTANDPILRDLEYYTYAAVDVVDIHNYFSAISNSVISFAVSVGDVYRNVSAVDRPAQISVAYKQVEDRPSIISEFTWTNPSDMSSEAPLITAASASLQDVDGLFWFAYGTVGYDTTLERWPVGRPNILGQFPGTALMYRRGDVAEAPVAFREGRSTDSLYRLETSLVVQGGGFDPTRDTGYDPQTGEGKLGIEATLVGKVELSFGEDWDYLHPDFNAHADYDQGIFRSLTGEVELNGPEGVFKVDTALAQGLAAYIGNQDQFEFQDCVIRMQNAFGSVLVISLDGLPIARSGKVLVQVGLPDETFGFETQDAFILGDPAHRIVNLGGLPFSMQHVDGEVILKGFAGAQTTILDLNGYPLAGAISFDEGADLRLRLPFNSLYTVVTREVTDASPVILSKVISSLVADKPVTARLHASGGDGSYQWSVTGGALPAGISLSPDGQLSGQTAAIAADPVTLTVVDGLGRSAQATLPVDIIHAAVNFVPEWIDDPQLGWVYAASPEWAYSFYLGWIYQPYRPWLYANPVGWMYRVLGDVVDDLWFYSQTRGWIYVESNKGGFFQQSTDGMVWEWDQFAL